MHPSADASAAACTQLEAACAHVTGTRQPLALLQSLLDTDALSKAREAAPPAAGVAGG